MSTANALKSWKLRAINSTHIEAVQKSKYSHRAQQKCERQFQMLLFFFFCIAHASECTLKQFQHINIDISIQAGKKWSRHYNAHVHHVVLSLSEYSALTHRLATCLTIDHLIYGTTAKINQCSRLIDRIKSNRIIFLISKCLTSTKKALMRK